MLAQARILDAEGASADAQELYEQIGEQFPDLPEAQIVGAKSAL